MKTIITVALLLMFFCEQSEMKMQEPFKEEDKMCLDSKINVSNSYVVCLDSEKSFKGNEIEYQFMSNANITKVDCIGSGHLVNYYEKNNFIYCSLSEIVNFTSLRLDFYNENELLDTCDLFFASKDNYTFHSSSCSLDTAKRNAGIELDYCLEEQTETSFSSPSARRAAGYGGLASGCVHGYFNWRDDTGNYYPLVGAKVRITIGVSFWEAITFTDEYGYYEINYDNIFYFSGGFLTLTLYADNGESIKVTKDSKTYSYVKEYSDADGDRECSEVFSPSTSGDFGKALSIFSIANCYANYAKELNNNLTVPYCSIEYPFYSSDPDKNIEHYDPNKKTVFITANKKYDTHPESYAAVDVIGHEYGHHLQKIFDFRTNVGGHHGAFENVIDEQFSRGSAIDLAKRNGLNLAWQEGWPTFWSNIAQQSFPSYIRNLNYTLGDSKYTDFESFEYDLDVYDKTVSYGDADEIAIQRILYKLWSSKKDGSDLFSLSSKFLWDKL